MDVRWKMICYTPCDYAIVVAPIMRLLASHMARRFVLFSFDSLFVCLLYSLIYQKRPCTYKCSRYMRYKLLHILGLQVALKRQQAVEDAIAMRLVSNETGKNIDALPPGKIFGMSITEPCNTPSKSNGNENLALMPKTKNHRKYISVVLHWNYERCVRVPSSACHRNILCYCSLVLSIFTRVTLNV